MNINFNLSAKDYHADMSHVSKSWLDQINICPAALKYYLDNARKTTKAFQFGDGFHTFVLEPERFYKEFIYAEAEVSLELDDTPKTFVKNEDMQHYEAMRKNLLSNQFASKLLSNGDPEVSVFFESYGVPCKARADFLKKNIIVDLKTCESADPRLFKNSIGKYRYDVQQAHYCAGFDIEQFIFIAIEKKPPYLFSINILDETSIKKGEAKRQMNLETYKRCSANDDWPGYADSINELTIPKWYDYG